MDTKTITLPSGKQAELNTFLTNRTRRDIKNFIAGRSKLGESNGERSASFSDEDVLSKWEDMKIKAVVKSIDGKVENIVDVVLDELSNDDYEKLLEEIEKVVTGHDEEVKKN